jgi:uncharacterized membrane protein YphA (DoxX/SURF4 family)
MPLTRRIARPLLAAIFVVGGLDALRNPAGKAKKARAVTEPLNEHMPATSNVDTETMVRINGGIQVGAGVLLATGWFRRVACLALMGSIVPTTYAGHRFWEEPDEATRAQQRMHFVKNLGLLGGLILAAVDTEGAPSLTWRAKRRLQAVESRRGSNHSEGDAFDLASKTKAAAAGVSGAVAAASRSGTKAAKEARRTGRRARHRMKDVGSDIAQKAVEAREGLQGAQGAAAGSIRGSGESAAHSLQQTGALVTNAARQLESLAAPVVHASAERAGATLAKLSDSVTSG